MAIGYLAAGALDHAFLWVNARIAEQLLSAFRHE